jgi:NADP-dependent 3-hydroxy acid dehydrogenase YdfG
MAEKVWMITGACWGLGAEIAKAVLAAGEKLIATAQTRLQRLESLQWNETINSRVIRLNLPEPFSNPRTPLSRHYVCP